MRFPTLVVAVNGDHGAIYYLDNNIPYAPEKGQGARGYEFYHRGRKDVAQKKTMPSWTRVPIGTIYDAVEEFITTEKRPTCIEWKPTI